MAVLTLSDLQAKLMNSAPKPDALLDRRSALGLMGGSLCALLMAACSGGSDSTDSSTSGSTSSTDSSSGSSASCSEVPEETGGPYPADGSQSGVTNVLANANVVRRDIRGNIGGGSVQAGLPLSLTITLENLSASCAALRNAAVYIWHCNADGEYSVYNTSGNGNHSADTFLRGVQISDSSGQVTFTTIYPGRYTGRATHIHVEVYSDSSFSTLLKTTQFAFTDSVNEAVYAADGDYAESQATSETKNARDSVFSDGYEQELLTLSGNATSGYTASITIGVVA